MRDIVFTVFMLLGLVVTVRVPYVGLLMWVLFSIMNPHQEVFGFARSVPWNLIIAIVTVAAWFASNDRKVPPRSATTVLVFALLAWCTFNMLFAFDPSYSWNYWNRAWKIVAMGVVAAAMTSNRIRFQALLWVVTLSLAFYGVKGGIFTLVTGSGSRVFGPERSMIFDNNTLADALVMVLPIMHYLRVYSEGPALRAGILAAMILIVVSIAGSYSREAYIAFAVLAIAFWLRTRRKFAFLLLAAAVLLPLLFLLPESIFERAQSIQHFSTDTSFQARLTSWWVAYRYAMDHFPFGAGFYGMNLPYLWNEYMPGEMHAAHSIYFQVLGEQGVPGLVLYLLVIGSGFVNLQAVRQATREVAEFAWARELAGMMQLSLLAFCVAGAAAPLDFFDLLFLWTMLSVTLRAITRRATPPVFAARPVAPFQPQVGRVQAPPA